MTHRILLCCALALSLSGLSPVDAAEQAGRDAERLNPLAVVPLDQLDQTRLRPLFSPARRQPATAPVALESKPEEPASEPPSLVLVGVVSDAQGTHAIIRPSPADKTRSLQIGDDFAGWNVVEIAPRRLLLRREQRNSAFALFEGRPRPASPAPRQRGPPRRN